MTEKDSSLKTENSTEIESNFTRLKIRS